MKIKVTYETSGKYSGYVKRIYIFNEVYEKAKSKKEKAVVHGYISKIEDLD